MKTVVMYMPPVSGGVDLGVLGCFEVHLGEVELDRERPPKHSCL